MAAAQAAPKRVHARDDDRCHDEDEKEAARPGAKRGKTEHVANDAEVLIDMKVAKDTLARGSQRVLHFPNDCSICFGVRDRCTCCLSCQRGLCHLCNARYHGDCPCDANAHKPGPYDDGRCRVCFRVYLALVFQRVNAATIATIAAEDRATRAK